MSPFTTVIRCIRGSHRSSSSVCPDQLIHLPARCRRLSPLSAPTPVNHAITHFNHVRLPPTALLTTPHRAEDHRAEFFQNIWRVIVGTMSLASFQATGLRVISCIAGRYSLRRKVTDASTKLPRPIISFSTQYIPVMTAVANAFVSAAFMRSIHVAFTDSKQGPGMKHFIAAVSKVTMFERASKDAASLGDRCGAQGMLQANQINTFMVCAGLSLVRRAAL